MSGYLLGFGVALILAGVTARILPRDLAIALALGLIVARQLIAEIRGHK
jgi:hypothetical protein